MVLLGLWGVSVLLDCIVVVLEGYGPIIKPSAFTNKHVPTGGVGGRLAPKCPVGGEGRVGAQGGKVLVAKGSLLRLLFFGRGC